MQKGEREGALFDRQRGGGGGSVQGRLFTSPAWHWFSFVARALFKSAAHRLMEVIGLLGIVLGFSSLIGHKFSDRCYLITGNMYRLLERATV